MLRSKYIIVLMAFFLFQGCAKDESTIDQYVEEELREYFLLFQEEGLKRGVDVDFETFIIEGSITNITTENVVGQCFHNTNEPEKVVIDRSYWSKAGPSEREFVVFHELGHCYLKRDHLNTSDDRGRCISIMNSGSNSGCRFIFNDSNRDALLDELFE